MPREFDHHEPILMGYPFYREYRQGLHTKAEYGAFLDRIDGELGERGILPYQRRCYHWVQADDLQNVRDMMAALGLTGYDEAAYQAFKAQVEAKMCWDPFSTSIYPDEERVAYALSMAVQPRRVFVAGSYFAYWAIFLLPGVMRAGGHVTLSDPNPAVCELAQRNLEAMGVADFVTVRAEDAEKLLQQDEQAYDLFVLDATGPRDHPLPTHRGKAIFNPLTRAALPHLHRGSYVLVHNHEIDDPDIAPMLQMLTAASDARLHMESYNCMGAYRIG
ncbi:MAG: class I SAM-dependent methyltransferase [Christensenellales bacterium]|jgi:predicted O-methyltransferase YrrM